MDEKTPECTEPSLPKHEILLKKAEECLDSGLNPTMIDRAYAYMRLAERHDTSPYRTMGCVCCCGGWNR